jgi:integrase
LGVLWLLMLGVGLRRGEALALRWSNLDLETGTVTIAKSLQRRRTGEVTPSGRRRGELLEVDPKTEASAATIALPEPVIESLRAHRRAQLVARMAARVRVDAGLVFTTGIGSALEPRNVNRAWDALCAPAGVRHLRVHDLRHATATFMLAEGVDLKVIQATLRHSRLSTTADVYAHVLAEVQRAGADRMGGMLTRLGPATGRATG